MLLAAPIWLPIFALTAFAVLLVEGRPVFFMQTRAGLHGRPFRIVKFRSMRTGSGSDAERLGRFGRFLRASSLDELPELFLVLVGKMSLVGPRPLPTRYLSRYTPAQIHGRNTLEWKSRFAHDVWYVDHRSLWLDAKILFLTIATVFSARGISEEGEATMSTFTGK